MIERYKKFLESKIGLDWLSQSAPKELIGTSNDLLDLFIELDDRYGFDIEAKIVFGDKEYDNEGKLNQINVEVDKKESENNKVIVTGFVRDINIEIVDNTRIFIENIISRNGRGFHVSKIIGCRVKKIYGTFRYGPIGQTWEDYDIDPNNHWKDWLGRLLTFSIKLNKKYHLDMKYHISFEVNFEI